MAQALKRRIIDGAVNGGLLGLFVGVLPAVRYARYLNDASWWPMSVGVAILLFWLPFLLCGTAIGAIVAYIADVWPRPASDISGPAVRCIAPVLLAPCMAAVATVAGTYAVTTLCSTAFHPYLPFISLAGTIAATLGSAISSFMLADRLAFRTAAAFGGGLAGGAVYPIIVALIEGPK